ncbi:MAG: polysaccharide biosynthesis C-terminal domain-containing protein [Candidatus Saccharibacteria bacterium]|nr:polysaccharide biosynthesis C-terminal domain-containing protein [Candidatus Saccharibacteria bacterium]
MSVETKGRNKYLLKNTAIFAVGNFASKFVSFFLVPLYTATLVAAEYGSADLLYTICNFLIPLLTLNITEGILRFSLDKNSDQKKIARIACMMIIPLLVLAPFSVPILNLFDAYRDYAIYFMFYIITRGISQIFLVSLKGQEKLKKYTLGNILHTLLIAGFNFVFLLGLHMGIAGYFLAYILSDVIISLYGIKYSNVLQNLKGSNFDKTLFHKMIKYSAVLIPTTFMWWIMNFLDRVMVTEMIGQSANGIYAVSYKIPTILSSVSSVFMQAWLFSAIKNNESEDNTKYTNKVFNALAVILTGTSIIILTFVRQFFKIYVSAEYYTAWEYVPTLMIGHVFLTLSTFISTSYNVNKDSKGHLRSASIGAFANLILNFMLIPRIGVRGAAIATTISYITVFIYRLFDTQKYLKIKITPKFIINIILVLISSALVFIDGYIALITQAVILLIFILMYRRSLKVLFLSINALKKKADQK